MPMTTKYRSEGMTDLLRPGIWLCVLTIIVLFPLSSPGRDLSNERRELVPGEWNPSLESVQTYIEEEFAAKTRKDQRFLNRTSQSMADLGDAHLFITYVLLMQTLDAKERTELFNEQKRWLNEREKLAQAAVKSKGGSLEPLEYSSAFRRITEQRLTELEKRFKRERTTTEENPRKKEE